MSLTLATWIAFAAALYVALGVGFAIRTHWRGIDPSDADVVAGSMGFRVAITPGLIALWPILLRRGLGPSVENFAHDRGADS